MAKKKSKKKRKKQRNVRKGNAYVRATYNNTMVTITDLNGNTLAWSSAGSCGFRGPKKATPYAASKIVENVSKKLRSYGVKELNVYVKGVGSGRDSAIRALDSNNFKINSISDVTPTPHNGCRPPGPRRI